MSNKQITLETIDIKNLQQTGLSYNLFYDIQVFMNYVTKRQVKRTYRTNELSKSEFKRLTTLMSISVPSPHEDWRAEFWIGFIDILCYELKFVTYDTQGGTTARVGTGPYSGLK